MTAGRRLAPCILLLCATLAACAAGQTQLNGPEPSRVPDPAPPPAESPPAVDGTAPPDTATAESPGAEQATQVEVRYRIENRADDAGGQTAGFAVTLQAVLTDPRGWSRAGFRFVPDPAAPFLIVLAEGPEVDRLCLPLETESVYSCQNGPVVALNADRWRSATPQWPADLAGYRAMLVNHEVGHLLHLHHPRPQCPGEGLPAPVMAQQSTEVGECLANPWPLQWEVDLAARREEPLAPPAEHDPSDHRPSPPAATS